MGEQHSVVLWFHLILSSEPVTVNFRGASQYCTHNTYPLSHELGWLEWIRIGHILSPMSVRLWQTPEVLALVSFSWGQSLLRPECSSLCQNGCFSPPPDGSRRGFFSDTVRTWCGDPFLHNLVSLEFLTLGLVYFKPPANHQFSWGFPTLALIPVEVSAG